MNEHTYRNLFRMGRQLLGQSDIRHLLNSAMDSAVELSGAERGMVILFNDNGNSIFEVARHMEKRDIDNPDFEISHTVMKRVRTSGEPLFSPNIYDEAAAKPSKSMMRLQIQSVICLPLVYEKRIFGVVYLDNRTVKGVFTREIFDYIKEFGEFISLAAYRALERKELQNHASELEGNLRQKYEFSNIIGHSDAMVNVMETVSQVADTDATVLIEGETGTGKELIARALHFNSDRKKHAFVCINCGAIPENLLESELFGYVKGAFTGAVNSHRGKFQQADGGTLFLDEVEEMSGALQVKLLRVLQTGEFCALGSEKNHRCDVRIVSASKTRLKNLVCEGRFRDDLYYRLNLIRLELPPLRERRSDIPLLIEYFLESNAREYNRPVPQISPEARNVLEFYTYPGNVRELENFIKRSVLLAREDMIDVKHLPPELLDRRDNLVSDRLEPFKIAKKNIVSRFEKEYLQRVLKEAGGVVRTAARLAEMHEKNFHEKLTEHGLRK